MTLPLLLVGIGALMLMLSVYSLRAQRLKERYALLFGAVALPFLGLALVPKAVGYLAQHLGIDYHTVVLLAVTTFFLLMNFNLLTIVSVQERRITRLAQHIGLLSQRRRTTDSGLTERRRRPRVRKAA